MTGQNKIEQEKPADDESLILVGECMYIRDAVEFINLKIESGEWRLLTQPFPLTMRAITMVDPSKPLINGRSPTKDEYIPASWGFVLHKFY